MMMWLITQQISNILIMQTTRYKNHPVLSVSHNNNKSKSDTSVVAEVTVFESSKPSNQKKSTLRNQLMGIMLINTVAFNSISVPQA